MSEARSATVRLTIATLISPASLFFVFLLKILSIRPEWLTIGDILVSAAQNTLAAYGFAMLMVLIVGLPLDIELHRRRKQKLYVYGLVGGIGGLLVGLLVLSFPYSLAFRDTITLGMCGVAVSVTFWVIAVGFPLPKRLRAMPTDYGNILHPVLAGIVAGLIALGTAAQLSPGPVYADEMPEWSSEVGTVVEIYDGGWGILCDLDWVKLQGQRALYCRNLPSQFQRHGLEVKITYRIADDIGLGAWTTVVDIGSVSVMGQSSDP